MTTVTGIAAVNFNLLDNSNIFVASNIIAADGPAFSFSLLTSGIIVQGSFESGFDNEDGITRVELYDGMTLTAVIDNVGLTDFDLAYNLYQGTQREIMEFVLRGDDTFNLSSENDIVDGFDGNDNIRAGGGNDIVRGSAGEDTLRGGPGEDVLQGGSDADSLVGQSDDDTLLGNDGEDVLKGGGGGDLLAGGRDDDFLKGGTDGDGILGGNGHDRLFGNAGRDQILGGRGHDLLNGGGEEDVLLGGRGNDTLKGGPGADIFYFSNNHGHDVVLDFDASDPDETINFQFNDDINSFSDVQAATEQVGDDVVITTSSSSSITLRDVDVVDLDASDFVF